MSGLVDILMEQRNVQRGQPLVCAILLTRDRPAMAARAVRCFRAQTYPNKRLLILDTGSESAGYFSDYDLIFHQRPYLQMKSSIGRLRNIAAGMAGSGIIMHIDDDDWSGSQRMAEQVALLQSSGADAVGYSECLFWRDLQLSEKDVYGPDGSDEPCDVLQDAWLYRAANPDYAIGASLCYWRRTWEHKPFPDLMTGEDLQWQSGLNVTTVSGMYHDEPPQGNEVMRASLGPRMICTIHGQNTSSEVDPNAKEWKRVPEWDEHCRVTLGGA